VRALADALPNSRLQKLSLDDNPAISLYMHDQLRAAVENIPNSLLLTRLTSYVYEMHYKHATTHYLNGEYDHAAKMFKRAKELKQERSCLHYYNLVTAYDLYHSINHDQVTLSRFPPPPLPIPLQVDTWPKS
jgi:tetratricopeptide (TPR) repeat protein